MVQMLYQFDCNILLWIQSTCIHECLSPFMIWLTHLGNRGLIWLVPSLLLCISRRTRRIGLLSIAAILTAVLVNNIVLKNWVGRIRPYDALLQVRRLIGVQNDFSFPSGHTAISFASASAIYFSTKKRYGIPCLLLAALIGFTRLYVGVHYPSDVLGGLVVGCLIGYLTARFLGNYLDRKAVGHGPK